MVVVWFVLNVDLQNLITSKNSIAHCPTLCANLFQLYNLLDLAVLFAKYITAAHNKT